MDEDHEDDFSCFGASAVTVRESFAADRKAGGEVEVAWHAG